MGLRRNSDRALFTFPPHVKQIVLILSTMRSGSTLLKALMGEADDVSNLPEINFQKFRDVTSARREIEALDASPILVLKRPAWYHETGAYPRLPAVDGLRAVVLVKDAYETVCSLRKMTFRKLARFAGPVFDSHLLHRYWAPISARLLDARERMGSSADQVRYEDLVIKPVEETARLFAFIGSSRLEGTDTYRPPDDFQWKWGRDDGGENIKSLQVQPPRAHGYKDRRLVEAIRRSSRVGEIRRRLGYPDIEESGG